MFSNYNSRKGSQNYPRKESVQTNGRVQEIFASENFNRQELQFHILTNESIVGSPDNRLNSDSSPPIPF